MAQAIENQLDKKYRYAKETAKEIRKLMDFYNDLRPTMSQYIFPDGTSKDMMSLGGTIPINYKGNTYNIPVEIWIMDTHPYNPPLCYVKPTADMKIKQNRHVDQNGRVYMPYLTEWNHAKSSLLECVQVMAVTFGEEPPVYSKKSSAAGGARNSQYEHSSSPVTTYPPVGAPGSYPAYPQQPGAYPPAPGYPPYAGAYPSAGPQSPAYPPPYNPPRQPYPTPGVANNGPSYPPVPYGQFNAADTRPGTGTLSEEHMRMSLMSAVEEKLGRRLNDIVAQAQMEISSLSQTHDELERGRRRLDDVFERLDKEQRTVDRNITILTEKTGELRALTEKNGEKENVDIDEAVVPAAPLFKQLLNAHAEDSALEDAIYYLGEALRREMIDLDTFLKHVRELSRRQFIQRALVHKCREKAGLP